MNFSRFSRVGLKVLLALILLSGSAPAEMGANPLRICADPNNMPFSNSSGQGFENRLADLLGRTLNEPVAYTWWAQRRGYVRNTIKAGQCDIWPGVATGVDMLATTQPYYRSTYVFVTRRDRNLEINSLDDPRLKRLQIGVQMVGDDANNTPPAHALADRGLTRNVHGYMLYGNYEQPEPQRVIIDAVETGKVDVAIVWGPIAGYFAAREPRPLRLRPVFPRNQGTWPMTFTISMGVSRKNPQLRTQLNRALRTLAPAIEELLNNYHIPLVPLTTSAATVEKSKLDSERALDKMQSVSFEH